MKEQLQPPPAKNWQASWSPRQQKLIYGIALANLQSGFPDILSAWRAAETHFGNRQNLEEARRHATTQ